MDDELFAELLISMREGGAILRVSKRRRTALCFRCQT